MIKATNIIKEFGEPPQRVLHSINVDVPDGEFLSITGRSGSGKSTLLYIMSTIDYPTDGTLEIDGLNPKMTNSKKLHEFRGRNIGFIFQFHYLLAELTAMENILLPAMNFGMDKELRSRAKQLLIDLDIGSEANKLPGQMSGGQQQRVAIARALIMSPKYIFADEPTGNLDLENGQKVMQILKQINQEYKTTIVLVTHEPDYAQVATREIILSDGHQTDI